MKNEAPNLKVIQSDATYFLWVDITEYQRNSDEFCEELRSKTGLYISSGAAYGGAGNGYVRINLATQRERIVDGMDRLIAFVKGV